MSYAHDNRRRSDGPKLEWQTVHYADVGHARVEVNRAEGRHGPLFSLRPGRHDKGRSTGFIRPTDVDDLIEALRDAHGWVKANGG